MAADASGVATVVAILGGASVAAAAAGASAGAAALSRRPKPYHDTTPSLSHVWRQASAVGAATASAALAGGAAADASQDGVEPSAALSSCQSAGVGGTHGFSSAFRTTLPRWQPALECCQALAKPRIVAK